MSSLAKSRLPKEFKILTGKLARRGERMRSAAANDPDGIAEKAMQEAYRRRVASVKATFGMWRDRDDLPWDGLHGKPIGCERCL